MLTNNTISCLYTIDESLSNLQDQRLKDYITPFYNDGSNLTITFLSFNRVRFSIRLLSSISKHIPMFKGKILIIDNASDQDQVNDLREHISRMDGFSIDLISLNRNLGVAAGRNKATEYIKTDWFMSLDNDIYLTGNPLDYIKDCIDKTGTHFLNVPLLQKDESTIDSFGGNLWLETFEDSYYMSGKSSFKNVLASKLPSIKPFISTFLYGGASVLKTKTFIEQGCYDDNMFVGFEDTEFSLRLYKQGIKIANSCGFCFVHAHEPPNNLVDINAEKVRFSSEKIRQSGEYFKRKHGLIVWRDSINEWIIDKELELGLNGSVVNHQNSQNNVDDLELNLVSGGFLEFPPMFEDSQDICNSQLLLQLSQAQSIIQAMESSKFWLIRNQWFKFRRFLGVNNDNQSIFLRLISLLKNEADKKKRYRKIIREISQAEKEHKSSDDLNILFLMPYMVVGGAEVAMLQLISGFKKSGCHVSIINTVNPSESMGDLSIKFYEVTHDIYKLYDLIEEQEWKGFLHYLINIKKIDVIVLSNSSFGYINLPELKENFPSIKIVNPIYSIVGHMVDNAKYASYIDMTVVENPLVEKYLVESLSRDPNLVLKIENGVDTNYFSPLFNIGKCDAFDIDINGKFVVSFIGRFSEEKGPDTYLSIVNHLKNNKNIHFILAGDGPMREKLAEIVEDCKISDRVSLTGFVDTRKVLSITNLLIVPSRIDGRPNVILESLSMGVPVIASNVGGIPYLINNEFGNGLLCNPNNISEFCDCIVNLSESPNDYEVMKQMSREYALQYLGVESMQFKYLDLCRSLLNKSKI